MKGNAATGGIGEDACEVAGSNTRGTADDADRQEDDDEEARDDDDGEDGEGGASQDQGKKQKALFLHLHSGVVFPNGQTSTPLLTNAEVKLVSYFRGCLCIISN